MERVYEMGMGRGRVVPNALRSVALGGSRYRDYEVTGDEIDYAIEIEAIREQYINATAEETRAMMDRLRELGITANPLEAISDLSPETIAVLESVSSIHELQMKVMETLMKDPSSPASSELGNMTTPQLQQRWQDVQQAKGFDPSTLDTPAHKLLVGVTLQLTEAAVAAMPSFNAVSRLAAEGPSGRVLGTYHFGTQQITLHGNPEPDRQDFMWGVFSHHTHLGVAVHEFGHALESHLRKTRGSVMDTFEARTSNTKALSDYGNTNATEAFAESFSAFATGLPRTNEYHRAFENLMSEVGLSSLRNVIKGAP